MDGHRRVRGGGHQGRPTRGAVVDTGRIAMAAVVAEHDNYGSRSHPCALLVRQPARGSTVGQLPIGARIEQCVQRGRIYRDDLTDPPLAVRVGVQLLGGVGQCGVGRNHLTGDRSVDLRDRLGRLDLADQPAGLHGGARGGELDEDHVPERILGVVGDPHRDPVPVGPGPFVIGGVAQLVRHVHSCGRYLTHGGGADVLVRWVMCVERPAAQRSSCSRRTAYSCTLASAWASLGASAQTWVTGSSGSGSTRAHPSSSMTLTPSTRTSSRPWDRSTSVRMTIPFWSHGVCTDWWAMWTAGSSATRSERVRPAVVRRAIRLTRVAAPSKAGRKWGKMNPPD